MRFEYVSQLGCSQQELAAWHFRPGAIHRLVPPWERIRVVREASPLVNGATAELHIRKGPFAFRLVALHEEVEPGRGFTDRQQSGPFRRWRHRHEFGTVDGSAELRDTIEATLPGGGVGEAMLGAGLRRELDRQFRFRHERTRGDLHRHAELGSRFGGASLRVGVTGASGLVGRQLCAFLTTGGHEVVRFVRGTARHANEAEWNPQDAEHGVDPRSVDGLDAIVHLAGAGIADRRWSPDRKQEILDSRVVGTRAIATAVARAARPPAVLVSASAIGLYGARGDAPIDERSERGEGFLADVVEAWEGATHAASDAGVRVVHARTGVVLSGAGGALRKMLLPFQLGAGGPIGNGRQGFSWISLDDAIAAIVFAIRDERLVGPMNVVAPLPLPQRGFAAVLGRVLRRPSIAPLPAPIVRTLFGELGQRLLLEGAFVRPTVLEQAGFRFEHSSLEQALRRELGRPAAGEPA